MIHQEGKESLVHRILNLQAEAEELLPLKSKVELPRISMNESTNASSQRQLWKCVNTFTNGIKIETNHFALSLVN